MKKNIILLVFIVLLISSCSQKSEYEKNFSENIDPTKILWYTHPVDKWDNALPVGNGFNSTRKPIGRAVLILQL